MTLPGGHAPAPKGINTGPAPAEVATTAAAAAAAATPLKRALELPPPPGAADATRDATVAGLQDISWGKSLRISTGTYIGTRRYVEVQHEYVPHKYVDYCISDT